MARCGNPGLGEIMGHATATGGRRKGNRPAGGSFQSQAGTHVGVAFHTEDLLQEDGEAGEDADAAPEAHGQDDVGLVPQELEWKGSSAQQPHPAGQTERAPPTPFLSASSQPPEPPQPQTPQNQPASARPGTSPRWTGPLPRRAGWGAHSPRGTRWPAGRRGRQE